MAGVDPRYFARVWRTDDEGESTVALPRRDGALMMRSTSVESLMGGSFDDTELFSRLLPTSSAGTYESASALDGRPRLLSYRVLSDHPDLVIVVGQSIDRVLSGWVWYLRVMVAAWVAFSLAIGAIAFWLLREWRRRLAFQANLQSAQWRLQAIMDYAVDGTITIDDQGTVQSFSKAAERMFGHTASEVVGRNVRMLMPEPYQSAHDRYVSTYLNTGDAKIIGIGREVQGIRKDGNTLPMDLAVGEIPGTDGRRQFVGTVRDISARMAADERVRQAEGRESPTTQCLIHVSLYARFDRTSRAVGTGGPATKQTLSAARLG